MARFATLDSIKKAAAEKKKYVPSPPSLPPSLPPSPCTLSTAFSPIASMHAPHQPHRDSDDEGPPAGPGGEDYYVGGNRCVCVWRFIPSLPPSLPPSLLPGNRSILCIGPFPPSLPSFPLTILPFFLFPFDTVQEAGAAVCRW